VKVLNSEGTMVRSVRVSGGGMRMALMPWMMPFVAPCVCRSVMFSVGTPGK
jgi:hypothetical protein